MQRRNHEGSQKACVWTAAALLVAATAGLSLAAQIDAIWIGGTGNYSVSTNWSGGVVPNNGGGNTYNVLIDNGSGTASSVTLNMNAAIDNLTVDANDLLTIGNNQQLFVVAGVNAGTVTNNGLIRLASLGNHTYFFPNSGTVTLTGSGRFELTNGFNWVYTSGGGSLINDTPHTIAGGGNIGFNNLPLTNRGTIAADLSTAVMALDPPGSGWTNTGVMRAVNGGIMRLQTGVVNSAGGGRFEALDGSSVQLAGGTIEGGTLATAGSGAIESIVGNGQLDGRTDTVNNTGLLRVNNNTQMFIAGTINNSATIHVNSLGNHTYLFPNGAAPVTLTGGGEILLSNGFNWIYTSDSASLTNMDNLIHGVGNIGNNNLSFDNRGEVVADNAAGILTCDPPAAGWTNTGTFRAEAGATLRLSNGFINNAGGLVEAHDGSVVQLASGTIQGGTLDTTGTGEIQSGGGASGLDGLTNGAITNTGLVRVTNNTSIYIAGTIDNRDTIHVSSAGSNTYLLPSGGLNNPATLVGGGIIRLSNSFNWIFTQDNTNLINQNNQIRGVGNIGNNNMYFDNRALVSADLPGLLTLDTPDAAGARNTGTLRAEGGGTLRILNGFVNNAGGTIEALNGSIVQLTEGTVRGGTLATAGTGEIQSSGGAGVLDGLTNGAINNTGLVRAGNNTRIRLYGTINNSGTIRVDSTGSHTYLQSNGGPGTPVTLSGGGVVQLTDAFNWMYTDDGGSLVNENNTIRGAGNIGANLMTFTNRGTLLADGAGQLVFDPPDAGTFDNQSTFSVTGAGGSRITFGPFTTSGTVTVAATRTLTRDGVYAQTAGTTTVNGTLTATSGLNLTGGVLKGTGTVSSTTNAASVEPGASVGKLNVSGTYSQQAAGELTVELGGLNVNQFDVLAISGAATLNGTLEATTANGFVPAIGDRFEILTAGSISGRFATFVDIGFPTGLDVDVFYTATKGVIVVVTTGDMNCDGAIDAFDIEPFIAALFDPAGYQAQYPNCEVFNADINRDGVVDAFDIEPFVDLLFGP